MPTPPVEDHARIGTTTSLLGARRPARTAALLALVAAACAVLLAVSGCGSGERDPEVDVQGAQTGGDGAGDGEIEPDGGGGKISIDVATLPFGGSAVPTGDLTQCATVGPNRDVSIPDGGVLTIAVQLDSDLLAQDPSACAGIDAPWCDGLEVTGVPESCNIGVVATRAPQDGEPLPNALMYGRLVCDEAVAAECAQTVEALSGSVTSVQFELPQVPGSESETTG